MNTNKLLIAIAASIMCLAAGSGARADYSPAPAIGPSNGGGWWYADACTNATGTGPAPMIGMSGDGHGNRPMSYYRNRCHGGSWGPVHGTWYAVQRHPLCPAGSYMNGIRGWYGFLVSAMAPTCINPSTGVQTVASPAIGVATQGNDWYRSVRCSGRDVAYGTTGTHTTASYSSVVKTINVLCNVAP